MRPVHMNPEVVARSFLDPGGAGTLFGMHWGTWRLTDEDPLEPPRRMHRACSGPSSIAARAAVAKTSAA
jgi:N-acyl-phosphatidylethanolamine-hydrolysing phospholipase D